MSKNDEADVIGEVDNDELYEHFHILADKGQSFLRIDRFLFDRIPNLSRNKIQQAATAGNILVNGKVVKSNYKVHPLDDISFVRPYPRREIELIPEDIPLSVIYEDEDLIIIDKPAGLVVHPGYGNYSGTLVNGLLYHFGGESKIKTDDQRPGLVHRLDKNTTGTMVIAKTEESLTILSRYFFERSIERTYWALVWGDVVEESGRIEGHIGRSLKNRKVMSVFPDGKFGKHAATNYKVLERFGYVTLVECKLETGRTHQIRVHFKHIGHPIFNDPEYGGDRIVKGTSFTKYKQFVQNCFDMIQRQALHAKTLGFVHPRTGKNLFFESELPEDFMSVVEKWRSYGTGNQKS
ncbi:MAG: RluA family pseudouridine synthase [Vicingaceae bacterium]